MQPVRRLPVWARYAIATAVVAGVYVLREAVSSALGASSPFLLYVPAVLLLSFAFNRGTGFYATLLSAALSTPPFRFSAAGPAGASAESWLALGLFVAIGLFSAALVEALRLTVDELGDREAALAQSDRRQRELLATLDLAAFLARDPFDDVIRFWSAGCERLYGWTAGEVVGRAAHKLLGTVFPLPREEIAAALERDGEWIGDLRQRTRDDAEIVVLARKVLRRDEAGRRMAVLESLVDVTAQRRAERALAESETRYRRLIEAVPHIVFTVRPDGAIDFCNERWRVYTGLTDCNLWLEAVHPEDRARTEAAWRHALDTGEPYQIEHRIRGVDGGYRHLLTRALPLRDDEGRILSWFGASTEISEVVSAREVLARDKAELERLIEARTAALMRASEEQRRAAEALRQGEKLQALGQLAGGVAHDFNNLLQVVAAGAEVLKKPALPPERRAIVLDGILQAASSARALTTRLLAFARKQPLRPETLDLNARLDGMAMLLRRTLGAGVMVATDFADDLWPVRVDPSQLEIAVLNLAVNARDAMPDGGQLSLTTRNVVAPPSPDSGAEEEFVTLVIRDTGVGMPPSVLAHIFEPFFTTKGPLKGTGLGLAQVHGFANQSGGDVSIESEPGEGTAITLRLPRARRAGPGEPAEATPPADRPRELGQMMARAAGKRVLIVEDAPDIAAFAEGLVADLGYETTIARGATEALSTLERGEPIDIVFSDVVMPGEMNGVDLARAVRQRWPGVAIVLVSGYSEALSGVEPALRAEVLAKPYVLDELGQALERALSRAGPREA